MGQYNEAYPYTCWDRSLLGCYNSPFNHNHMQAMKPDIVQYHADEEFLTDEGCYINELSNSAEDPGLSIARARVEPGVTTRWHRLSGTVERYVILAGVGRVEIGNVPPTDVREGDVVIIPPMCPQRITNIGDTDLLFLAICSPRFVDTVYHDINDT